MLRQLAVVLVFLASTIGHADAAMSGPATGSAARIVAGVVALAVGLFLLSRRRRRTISTRDRPSIAVPRRRLKRSASLARGLDTSMLGDDCARTGIEVCEQLPEVEQAKVLLSLGRTDEAAQALAGVSSQPAEGLDAWLRRAAAAPDPNPAHEQPAPFNVSANNCPDNAQASLEDYPHVLKEVMRRWGRADCAVYLDCLMLDSRSGKRAGFPVPVAEEIVLLRRVLQERLS